MADELNLRMVPVYRPLGDELVVPSIVHWSLNHYVAITERAGDRYKIEDPATDLTVWMDADAINSEASGFFLVPLDLRPPSWITLSKAETDQVVGGSQVFYPFRLKDEVPGDCGAPVGGNSESDPNNPSTAANPGNPADTCKTCNDSGGHDNASSSCSTCPPGMPVWKVIEPYTDLWLVDTPLTYTKSQGEKQIVKMIYNQRDARPCTNIFSFGPSWECNLLSYFFQESGPGNIEQWLPGGGRRTPPVQDTPNPIDGSHMAITTSANGMISARVELSDVATVIYLDLKTNADGSRYVFMSQQVDRYGRTNLFTYASVSGVPHLVSVTDYDGRSMALSYTNTSFPHQITEVQDPYGRTVKFRYDSTGKLTNIVDALGISSTFKYDGTTGWMTNMTTPYGTTAFKLTGSTNDFSSDPTYSVNRSALVTEPNGSKQLYIYRFDSYQLNHTNSTILIDTNWPSSEIPTLPYSNALDTSYPQKHNTYYWNRLQYAALNSTFKASGDFNDLAVADYKLPRRRHWLADSTYNYLSGTLGVQREPSPDGTTLGQTTWYDYAGKGLYSYGAGTNSNPSTIAWVLPNGQTHYKYFEYFNSYFNPTMMVESYDDGSVSRTNWIAYYLNGDRDLLYRVGARGEVLGSWGYNTNHQVVAFTNAVSDITTYSYSNNTARSILQRSLPTGLTSSYGYDGNGFMSVVADTPINATNNYTYSGSFVRTHTDARGLCKTNTWDDLERLTGTLFPDGTTISNIYTYLDITATKDRLGNWSYATYDSVRQKTSETDANGVVTGYGYCDCGSLLYLTNAVGTVLQQITSFSYNYQGNRTQTVYPDTYTVTYKYDSLKRLTNSSDSVVSVTNTFNNQGLLVSVNTGAGQVLNKVFDIEDRVTIDTDANGVAITNTYDNLGRLVLRTYPDNNGNEQFLYTSSGLFKYTNQLNLVTSYGYDVAGSKTSETNANSEIFKYSYNAAGDLKTLTDGKNQVTTWNYDLYGRVTNKLDQASVEILRYQYDANSRLTNRWSKAMTNTTYGYDNVGNLMSVDYPSGTTDVTYSYDALNRLTNMVDAAGTTKFTYTSGGQMLTEDGPWSSDTVTYSYANRLRSGLSLQQPTGAWTNGFTYDSARRLSTVDFSGGTFTYTYQTAGSPVKKIALPNTSYITNTYDNMLRLTGTLLNNSSHTTLDKMDYLYNTNSQRIRLTRTDGSYYTNTYDNIGQLRTADSTVASEDRNYGYDAAWNLNKRTNNATVYTFSVDEKNQLTNGPTGLNQYDYNGNMTSRIYDPTGPKIYYYEYDAENQLKAVYTDNYNTIAANRWKTEFTYDGKGRLRKRIDYTWLDPYGWFNGVETRYVYDGMRVIQERNSSNSPTVAYTRGSDLSGSLEGAGGIGGLLERSHAYQSGSGSFTNHNYYHADSGGNVTYMVNSSQSMVASYRYDPFGNTISSSGSLASANAYRFSSKEIHVNSGMYYYGYRWYDPNLQRWLNRDPIGEEGDINLFRVVRNDAFKHVDPAGRDAITSGMGPYADLLQQAYLYCRCLKMAWDKSHEAEDWADELVGTQGAMHPQEGSPSDMLTHCVASCEIAKNEGVCIAAGTDIRKRWQNRENPLTRPGNRMDYENNKVGFGIADSGGDCKKGCVKALNEGKLWTIDQVPPNTPHPFTPSIGAR